MDPVGREVLVDDPPTAITVDLSPAPELTHAQREALRVSPVIVIGVSGAGPSTEGADIADVVVAPGAAMDAVLGTCLANPLAATALSMLLRSSEARAVGEGLLAESSTYSMLQGAPEFARWHAGRPARKRTQRPSGSVVDWSREGSRLDIVLARPEVHNAYNAQMRDELLAVLSVAQRDSAIVDVHIRGDGPSFCSGGDLDEFGSLSDPASAHLLRLGRSPAHVLHQLARRVTTHLHGACMGSGIELPAFGGRIVARPDTIIGLPEVALGLIPGAGGTVSLPRRIGRHRTAELALTGRPIDVSTALEWGLVDGLEL